MAGGLGRARVRLRWAKSSDIRSRGAPPRPWGPRAGGRTRRRRAFQWSNALAAAIFAFVVSAIGFSWLLTGELPGRQVTFEARAAPEPAAATERATFPLCREANGQTCVIDGDTFRYRGMTVRIADIDTPEVFDYDCVSEKALGERATRRLQALMNAGPFALEPIGRDEDVYGRKLRIITRGGQSVGMTLVAEGFARKWDGARRGWC